MTKFAGLAKPHQPDWQGLVDNILRKGTPDRVYHMELFHDWEVRNAIAERFGLLDGVSPDDPNYERKKLVAVNRFIGWDYVVAGVGVNFEHHRAAVADTAALAKDGGRTYQDEHTGPIMSWEDFEAFDWPDPNAPEAEADLEWFQENLPEDMCIVGGLGGHFCEELSWLMGYETLCYALFDRRDLVEAIAKRLGEIFAVCQRRTLAYDRVKMVWSSDDMGFKTGLLIGPDDMREFVLANHKALAAEAHEAGRPYLLHACGNLHDIIDDLTDDVRVDAKHSFEDTIEDVRDLKKTYGRRTALLGGIDVDFLCRADEAAIRQRVRDTLDVCQPGGGYCLGTGNSVANYVPLESYLAMVDEGRLYGG